MRQMISGLIAAMAVVTVSAVPAMACGGCPPCGQVAVSPCGQSYYGHHYYSGYHGYGYRQHLTIRMRCCVPQPRSIFMRTRGRPSLAPACGLRCRPIVSVPSPVGTATTAATITATTVAPMPTLPTIITTARRIGTDRQSTAIAGGIIAIICMACEPVSAMATRRAMLTGTPIVATTIRTAAVIDRIPGPVL